MSFLKRFIAFEPVLSAASVQAVLALLAALGVLHLSAAQTGAVLAVAAGVLAVITAYQVDKASLAVWTGLAQAAGTLLVAFGVKHWSATDVAAFNTALTVVLGSLLREKVSPLVSSAPVAPPPAAPAARRPAAA